MGSTYEKVKSYFRNKKIYKALRSNSVLLKINQHYRDQVESQKRESVQQYGYESLLQAKETFAEMKGDFWLDYGTLLGAIREKDFIGHDSDIDIGTYFTSNEEAKALASHLKEKGFEQSRQFWLDGNIVEETYLYKGVNLDVYYYREGEGQVQCYALEEGEHTIYNESPEKTSITGLNVRRLTSTFTGITWIDFKGNLFPIPESYDAYLKGNYGESYMIKNANWNWTEEIETEILPFENNTKAYLFH